MTPELRTALDAFIKGAQAKVDKSYEQYKNQSAKLTIEENPKYIRVVSNYYASQDSEAPISRSVYCFIDRETGRVWKGKSWASPEKKNPRSCIFNPDHGLSGVDWHGTVYLR